MIFINCIKFYASARLFFLKECSPREGSPLGPGRGLAISLITAMFFFLPLATYSQSLAELLVMVKQENLELKAMKQDVQASLQKISQVGQLPDTKFGLGVFVSPVETRLGRQRISLNGNQDFPWFGTLQAEKELAEAGTKAFFEHHAAMELDEIFKIKESYFDHYLQLESEEILKQHLSILESMRRLSLRMIETGKSSASDLLMIDLEIDKIKQEILIFESNTAIPLADINQLINRPLDTPFTGPDTLVFARLPFTKNTILNSVRTNYPYLKTFDLEQEVARQKIALNEMESKPSFSLGLSYILVDPLEEVNPNRNGKDILQVLGSVQVPLNRQRFEARKIEENLKIEALANRKRNATSLLSANIEKAYANYKTAQLRFELYERQIKNTQDLIQVMQAEYSNGTRKFEEILQMERKIIDYRLEVLRAIIESHLAKATVEQFIIFDN